MPRRFLRIPSIVHRIVSAACVASILFAFPSHAQVATTLREHIDPARLSAGRDSFAVVMQGKPRGWQRLTATRIANGWELGDAVTIDSLVRQASVITLNPDLSERSLRQEGVMRGREMKISLDFQNGRVRGNSMTPTSGPTGALSIDTAITSGTIDDNAVTPLMSSVRYTESFAISFPVLSSGKGTITQQQLRVLGSESVTVPAGQFETWRVELRAERSVVIANVTKAAPYRLVRISNGPAFEIVLLK